MLTLVCYALGISQAVHICWLVQTLHSVPAVCLIHIFVALPKTLTHGRVRHNNILSIFQNSFFCLFACLLFKFFETRSHYVGIHYIDHGWFQTQRSACFCFLSVQIKGGFTTPGLNMFFLTATIIAYDYRTMEWQSVCMCNDQIWASGISVALNVC